MPNIINVENARDIVFGEYQHNLLVILIECDRDSIIMDILDVSLLQRNTSGHAFDVILTRIIVNFNKDKMKYYFCKKNGREILQKK